MSEERDSEIIMHVENSQNVLRWNRLSLFIYCSLTKTPPKEPGSQITSIPANTNVDLMQAHRLWRWPSIKPQLGECVVFVGNKFERHWSMAGCICANISDHGPALCQLFPRQLSVCVGLMLDHRGPTLNQHRPNVSRSLERFCRRPASLSCESIVLDIDPWAGA